MANRRRGDLEAELDALRQRLERAYGPDTAASNYRQRSPAAGQCAAVSAIVRELMGGDLVSTIVEGRSHWLNRLSVEGDVLDVDMTGSQFGREEVQVGPVGTLYPDTRVRAEDELDRETLLRAKRLAQRAKLNEASASIDAILRNRSERNAG